MGKLLVKRTVDEKKDKSVDVTWVIPRYNSFSSTMFFAALKSSFQHFDITSKNFDSWTSQVNIVVKMHFVDVRLYVQFINYMMDNYPDIFFDKSGNLKQNGGMI